MRARGTVEGMDGEWIIGFSRADRELLDMMKEAVPQSGRRWDIENQLWQTASSDFGGRRGAPLAPSVGRFTGHRVENG